jgi:hypothetical protein
MQAIRLLGKDKLASVAAQADSLHPQQHLSLCRRRLLHRFDSHVPWLFQYECLRSDLSPSTPLYQALRPEGHT